jgi:hypothetical protein
MLLSLLLLRFAVSLMIVTVVSSSVDFQGFVLSFLHWVRNRSLFRRICLHVVYGIAVAVALACCLGSVSCFRGEFGYGFCAEVGMVDVFRRQ